MRIVLLHRYQTFLVKGVLAAELCRPCQFARWRQWRRITDNQKKEIWKRASPRTANIVWIFWGWACCHRDRSRPRSAKSMTSFTCSTSCTSCASFTSRALRPRRPWRPPRPVLGVLHVLYSMSPTSFTPCPLRPWRPPRPLHPRRPWCPLCIYTTSVTPVIPELLSIHGGLCVRCVLILSPSSTSHPLRPPRFLCPGHPALYIPLGSATSLAYSAYSASLSCAPPSGFLLRVLYILCPLCPLRPRHPIRPLSYRTASLTSHVRPSILPLCLVS